RLWKRTTICIPTSIYWMTWKYNTMWWRIRRTKQRSEVCSMGAWAVRTNLRAGRNAAEKLHDGMDGGGSVVRGDHHGRSLSGAIWQLPSLQLPAFAGAACRAESSARAGACRRLVAALSGSAAG